MEIWQARYAMAVAETLSFRRAAERLNMSQPPLSRAIAGLEDELGVKLFERGARGVQLTPAGRAFRVEAETLLRQADRTIAAARTLSEPPPSLRLGFEGPAASAFLPAALRALKERHPDAELILREMSATSQAAALREGVIDAGVVFAPLEDTQLQVTEVWREPLVAVLPRRHRLAGARSIRLADLAQERFVTGGDRNGCGLHYLTTALCRIAGFAPQFMVDASDVMLKLDLLACGAGVALLPLSALQHMHDCLAAVPLSPNAEVVLCLAHRREPPSEVVADFIAVALNARGNPATAGCGSDQAGLPPSGVAA